MLAGVLATLTAILGAFQSPKVPPPVPQRPEPATIPSPAPHSDVEPREPDPTTDAVERWRPLVKESGLPVEWALRTMRCESRGNPGAVNRAGPYHGLMQVYRGSFDPATNLAQARAILARQGRRSWPTCG